MMNFSLTTHSLSQSVIKVQRRKINSFYIARVVVLKKVESIVQRASNESEILHSVILSISFVIFPLLRAHARSLHQHHILPLFYFQDRMWVFLQQRRRRISFLSPFTFTRGWEALKKFMNIENAKVPEISNAPRKQKIKIKLEIWELKCKFAEAFVPKQTTPNN